MEEFVKGGAFLIESISPQEVFTPEEFNEEHIRLFKSLPQDFMEIYVYTKEIEIMKPFVLWFTGLLSSGKTTLAESLKKEFSLSNSSPLTVLDGDAVRQNISKALGFSFANSCLIGAVTLASLKHDLQLTQIEKNAYEQML